jgi:hypothetical protein
MDRNEEISPDVQDIMRQLNVDDDKEGTDVGITDALNELLSSNVATDDIARLLEQINGMNNERTQAATQMGSISTVGNEIADVKMEPSMTVGSSLNEASNIAAFSTSTTSTTNPSNKESASSTSETANTSTGNYL